MSKVLTSLTPPASAQEVARPSLAVQSASDERFKDLLKSYEFATAKPVARAPSKPFLPVNTTKTTAPPSIGGVAKVASQLAASRMSVAPSKLAASEVREENRNPQTAFKEGPLKLKEYKSQSETSFKMASNGDGASKRSMDLPLRNSPKENAADLVVSTEPVMESVSDEGLADNLSVLTEAHSSTVSVIAGPLDLDVTSASASSGLGSAVASGAALAIRTEGAEDDLISLNVKTDADIGLPTVSSFDTQPLPERSEKATISTQQSTDETPSIPTEHKQEASPEVEDQHATERNSNTIIYQVHKGNTPTTHIQMVIGAQQTVHIEIGSAAGAEHTIQIETDSDDVFHALKSGREELIESLRQSSFLPNDVQPLIPFNTQVQVGLLTACSSEGGTGDKERSSGDQPNKGGASEINGESTRREVTTKRQEINGVINFIV